MKKTFVSLLTLIILTQTAMAQDLEQMVAGMSRREKIAQIIFGEVNSYGKSGENAATVAKMKELQLGGIITDDDVLKTSVELMNEVQEVSRIPLLLTIDGEWGASMRFREYPVFPRAMQLGALKDADLVYEMGKAIGEELKELNILVNYAPDVDVNNNPNNPVIGIRSFGENKHKVAMMGSAYMLGMKAAGVAGSAKHFPGHGDTDVDSHKGLPVLQFDRGRLDTLELFPFRRLIADGVDMVMVGHLSVPALDPSMAPASVSRPIITDLLRKELGFEGIIITDALGMKGIAGDGVDASVESYKAGSDILLMPIDAKQSIDNLDKAFESGELDEKELDAKVLKILKFKKDHGMFDASFNRKVDISTLDQKVIRPKTEELIQKIADKSLTIVKGSSFLPMEKFENCAYIAYNESENSKYLTDMLKEKGVEVFNLKEGVSNEELYNLRLKLNDYKNVIVGFHSGSPKKRTGGPRRTTSIDSAQFKILSSLGVRHKAVGIYFGIPYDLNNFKEDYTQFKCFMIGYEDTKYNNIAAGKILLGKIKAEGTLPVAAGIYECGFSE